MFLNTQANVKKHCISLGKFNILVFDSSLFRNCLVGLSISELLTLKHSLNHSDIGEKFHEYPYEKDLNTKPVDTICEKPSTMALVAERKGYEDTHPSYEPWQPEEKPSKLQTLFQISVTALAFLSFGGYLLCLIVQSIKSKGTTFFHPTTSTMATTNGMKRIKVYRRSRRSSFPSVKITQNYVLLEHQYSHSTSNPYQYYESKYRNFY